MFLKHSAGRFLPICLLFGTAVLIGLTNTPRKTNYLLIELQNDDVQAGSKFMNQGLPSTSRKVEVESKIHKSLFNSIQLILNTIEHSYNQNKPFIFLHR